MTAPTDSARSEIPLLRAYPVLRTRLHRLPFGESASPVAKLSSLSRLTGGDLWIKNDGEYGSLYGGNKARKLEFVLADALQQGVRTLITTGALGTNHGLATALYGAQAGLRVALLLTYEEPSCAVATQLLRMAEAGADIHYVRSHALAVASALHFVARYRRDDHRMPYILGPGGSSALAAMGYVNAAFELADQVRLGDLPEPGTIVVPAGTGGTAAGLLVGLRLAGLDSRLVGVAVTRAPTAWRLSVLRNAGSVRALLARLTGVAEIRRLKLDGFTVTHSWRGPGLGRPSAAGAEAADRAWDDEGLRLDPVYTAKTMAAALALCRQGSPGPVLYWHTWNARELPEPSTASLGRLPVSLRRVCERAWSGCANTVDHRAGSG
jgi:D-cysteine desulfhydrase